MRAVESEVVLITDVTGRVGRSILQSALRFGAARVYACAPRSFTVPSPYVVPVVLDADSPDSVGLLRATAADATVMVHTSSTPSWPPVSVSGGDLDAIQRHFSRTVIRPLRLAASLAPTLAANGGVIACVESVQAWINLTGAFAVAQSALWSAVNALRLELRGSGIHVLAAIGAFEEGEYLDVQEAADVILAGIHDRAHEVVLDAYTSSVRHRLSGPIERLYPELDG